MQRRCILQFFAAAAILPSSSCCKQATGDTDTGPEVAQFHSRYNAGDYSAIYANADETFRQTTSEADFTAFIDAVHRKLGEHRASSALGTRVTASTKGRFVNQSFDSQFTGGKGTETFSWRITDGHAVLIGYHINSPTLVLK